MFPALPTRLGMKTGRTRLGMKVFVILPLVLATSFARPPVSMEPLAVSTGAVAGALLRWKVTEAAKKHGINPWTTMGINIGGSFILGACASKNFKNSNMPLLIGTGFCGSFTTLSTFSVDVLTMLQKGQLSRAGTLILVTNAMSIGAAGLGYKLFKP